ncbi:response regulator transcription factor [Paenibacillus sp. HN-1]|uniref:response regulator transcription factor n=1 Tax=Paenibacillus TaxID=44249 RepID=UPI001CA91D52|nr:MULTISPECIES: response regulator transcription factor [Paenibacillus]MBY9080153.1 response regulator transcription factor [Paenibacillus sp. CGMCC 1.18879]MBY9087773.1 response regulator transcription factor [Paenibacillus sinensis]
MDKIRVLIAEDQDLIRKSLGIVLGMNPDIEVSGMAGNGRNAVALAESLLPDVVLMDIHMPVMDGVEATREIKAKLPEVKVIILTTFQEMDIVTGALNAGAEGYILKAIDPADLAGAIRLVRRGETMITQEVARALFARSLTGSGGITGGEAPAKESFGGLTERELQVLRCISDGLANRQIAERLYLSEGTVKNYISSIYSKLNVQNRASAMRKAAEEGLF